MGLFTREVEGESLEFGYCFDVSGLSRGGDWDRRDVGLDRLTGRVHDDAGCDTSFFPCLGVVVCHAIYPLAGDSQGQLVSTIQDTG